MAWVAHCTNCNKEVYRANNGDFTAAAARIHVEQYLDHKVLIGYETRMEGNNLIENDRIIKTLDVQGILNLRAFHEAVKIGVGHSECTVGLDEKRNCIWIEFRGGPNEKEMQAQVDLMKYKLIDLLLENSFEFGHESVESTYAMLDITPTSKERNMLERLMALEGKIDGEFRLNESTKILSWQYKVESEDDDLSDIITDATDGIEAIILEYGYEIVDLYAESSFASFNIKPKVII
jgi:hypothetical protein